MRRDLICEIAVFRATLQHNVIYCGCVNRMMLMLMTRIKDTLVLYKQIYPYSYSPFSISIFQCTDPRRPFLFYHHHNYYLMLTVVCLVSLSALASYYNFMRIHVFAQGASSSLTHSFFCPSYFSSVIDCLPQNIQRIVILNLSLLLCFAFLYSSYKEYSPNGLSSLHLQREGRTL